MKLRFHLLKVLILSLVLTLLVTIVAVRKAETSLDNTSETLVYLPLIKKPDDSKILFSKGSIPISNQFSEDIYIINNDGSNPQNLTQQFYTDDYHPSWSPDRTQIAFVSMRDGKPEIYVMDADGSNQTRLTNNSIDELSPTWHPDGNRIFFAGNDSIYYINSDGTGIFNTGLAGSHPSLSPHGWDLAFGYYGDILLAGSTVINLTNNTSQGNYDPEFSPDGNKIVFDSFRDGESKIYVMNKDGTNQIQLTNDFGAHPTWNPTGDKIAFVCTTDLQICTMNADGSNIVKITQGQKWSTYPDW